MGKLAQSSTKFIIAIVLTFVAVLVLLWVFQAQERDTTPQEPAQDTTTTMPEDETRPGEGEIPDNGGDVMIREARVENIDILVMESFPVQVAAVVTGNLSDGCTEVEEVTSTRDANTFTVTVVTSRPVDAFCTQALVPFEERVTLDVLGLDQGTYAVEANGAEASFTLDADNRIE